MIKKAGCALLCVAVISIVVTGCRSSEKGSSNTLDGSVKSLNAIYTKPPVTNETIKLTLWGAEGDQKILKEAVKGFEEENPKQKFDIKIGVQSESKAKDRVLKDIESAADVYSFADDQINSLVEAGALQPIYDEDIIEENTQGSVEASTIDGVLYAYPYTADNGYFMYYNKKYFSEDDVKTLDGMLRIAEKSGKTIAMDWASAWYIYSFFGGAGLEASLCNDGKNMHCNWNATDTEIKGVEVAQAMLDISARKSFKSLEDKDIQKGFKDGSVIAGVDGTWASTKTEKVWEKDYGTCKLPTYTCAGKQIQMASFAGYKLMGVNPYSKNVGWALELAKWITNEKNQTEHFVKTGIGPSNIAAASDDAVRNSSTINALIEQADYASIQRVGEKFWKPVAAFGKVMANGNEDGTDLQELLDQMVKEVTMTVE